MPRDAVFRWLDAPSDTVFLLLGDHAGQKIPAHLNRLGLNDAEAQEILPSHRCYDLGTAELLTALHYQHKIPAILANYSRLVVDLNRHPYDPTAIRPIYDCREIRGNRNLTIADQQQRVQEFFTPYHQAIADYIRQCQQNQQKLLIISIHSFTPQLAGGAKRKEEIALLYHQDLPFIADILQLLGKDGLVVGDNQPYSSKGAFGYTLELHGSHNHVPAIALEYRQDYLQDADRMQDYVNLTTDLLEFLQPFARVPECGG